MKWRDVLVSIAWTNLLGLGAKRIVVGTREGFASQAEKQALTLDTLQGGFPP